MLSCWWINENSRNGYGLTFIHELRLWKCYNCSTSFRNFNYVKSDFNFNAVLHVFWGNDIDRSYSDIAGGVLLNLEQVSDFKGYTVLDNMGWYITCDESSYQYYNEDTGENGQCITQYNVTRFDDFKLTIPGSRTGRYKWNFGSILRIVFKLVKE